ncbi:hypothetical protein GWI33_005604 [Rhynchophorus ferrugineus]|uniref:Uncharacterized protein n=1 Tax=Rhynchophorus ferrugineus TaxID=354439 RepID=A0A834MHU1_RHYFE|nr:hypothetical protein GWI33_005604 [Rhynchophorus ferrugineus]
MLIAPEPADFPEHLLNFKFGRDLTSKKCSLGGGGVGDGSVREMLLPLNRTTPPNAVVIRTKRASANPKRLRKKAESFEPLLSFQLNFNQFEIFIF